MPPLSILVKPASSACDLRCSYCFYADEIKARAVPDRGMMSWEVSHALIEKAARAGEGTVSFLFQGGEPTLAGLDFFRDLVARVSEVFPKNLKAQYAIQTNGTLLDEDWCRFFRENHFLVGLSLDGTRACHDRFRRDKAGKSTYDRAVQAARSLERYGVEHTAVAVVTGHLARHAQSVFAALCGLRPRSQQYIPCLDPLVGEWSTSGCSLSPEAYGGFLKTLFDLWYRELEQGRYWSVRYFDNLIWMLDGRPPEQCSMAGRCSPQYMIEADGSVYPCDFYGLDAYRLGNVLWDTWAALDRAREELGFIQASCQVPEECRSCPWYPLCRSGCRRERQVEGGRLGRSRWCRAYAGFLPYALPRLHRARDLLFGRGPAL